MKTAVSIELVTDDRDGFAYRHLAIVLKRLLRDSGWKCKDIRCLAIAPAKALHGDGTDNDTTIASDAPGLQTEDFSAGRVTVAPQAGRNRGDGLVAGRSDLLASATGLGYRNNTPKKPAGGAACATPNATNKAWAERRIA